MNNIYPKDKSNLISRLKFFFLTVGSLLAAFIIVFRHIKEVIESDLLLYIFVIFDLFKIEYIFLLIILWTLPMIKMAISNLRNTIRGLMNDKWRRDEYFLKNYRDLIYAGIVITVTLIITIYNSFYYVKGKYIHVTNYHRILITRAEGSFLEGKHHETLMYLNACNNIFSTPRSQVRLEAFNERLRLANSTRRLLDCISKRNYVGRIKLIEDIYYLDRDFEYYYEMRTAIYDELHNLFELYESALENIATGQNATAMELLKEIQDEYPGFCDCHVLLNEVEKYGTEKEKVRISNRPYDFPYLYELERVGKYRFAEMTRKSLPSLILEYTKVPSKSPPDSRDEISGVFLWEKSCER